MVWRDLWHRFPVPGSGSGSRAKAHLLPGSDGIFVEAFLVSTLVVGLAEIGDKTQIATVGLAAHFENFCFVVIGTTLGMVVANVPAVIIGDKLAGQLLVKAIRVTAAIVFATLGIITLSGVRL